MASNERTFIAIKPDGVQRGLISEIIGRFERRGFKLVAARMVHADDELLNQHYSELTTKGFFKDLVTYMKSGPIFAMVWEGRNAVKIGRDILGATNPANAAPGTIRFDYCIDIGRNVCHGSDSVETAKKEIALWFRDSEIQDWKAAQVNWVFEKIEEEENKA